MANPILLKVVGLHKLLTVDGGNIVPLSADNQDKIIFAKADAEDAEIFGERFYEGSLWTWEQGDLHAGSPDNSKQDKLKAGVGIRISEDNEISADVQADLVPQFNLADYVE